MADDRVSLLRATLFGRRLPERSDDPRLRRLEDQLVHLRLAPDPDPQFRSELRAQLVAIAPRIVAEGAPPEVEAAGKHRAGTTRSAPAGAPARHADARGRRFPVARTLRVATALVAVCALLLGGAWWMSRKALPGDNLYGLKRAGERVQLSLAGSKTAGAKDELQFAQRRYNEVLALWKANANSAMGSKPSADAGVNAETTRLIAETLDAGNEDLYAGASGLNSEAVRTKSSALITTLTTWAQTQGVLLRNIKSAMAQTDTKLVNNVGDSAKYVQLASQRASALAQSLGRSCPQHQRADEYGPLPCTGSTASQPSGQPSGGGSGSTGTGGTGGGKSGSSGGAGTGTKSGSQPGNSSSRSASPNGNGAPATSSSSKKAPGLLPTTPAKASVGKSCISVSAGPIDVNVGCPSG